MRNRSPDRLFVSLFPFPSFREAPTSFVSFGPFHYADQVGVRRRTRLLSECAEAIKLPRQKGIVFSKSGQAKNHLVEADVDVKQMLVDFQPHRLCPPAVTALAGVPGGFAIDVMVESPGAATPRVMTFLTRWNYEGKWGARC